MPKLLNKVTKPIEKAAEFSKENKQEGLLALCIAAAQAAESISDFMPGRLPLKEIDNIKDTKLSKLFHAAYKSGYFVSDALHSYLAKILDGRLGPKTFLTFTEMAGDPAVGQDFYGAVDALAKKHGLSLTANMKKMLKFVNKVDKENS